MQVHGAETRFDPAYDRFGTLDIRSLRHEHASHEEVSIQIGEGLKIDSASREKTGHKEKQRDRDGDGNGAVA
jgi:hypothetical protein